MPSRFSSSPVGLVASVPFGHFATVQAQQMALGSSAGSMLYPCAHLVRRSILLTAAAVGGIIWMLSRHKSTVEVAVTPTAGGINAVISGAF